MVKINGRFFVLTCRHIVLPKYKDEEVKFAFRPENELRDSGIEEIKHRPIHKLISRVGTSYLHNVQIINRIYSDSIDDIVLLELDPASAEARNYEFYDILSRGILNPELNKPLYLMGFPGELARWVTKRGYGVFPYFLESVISSKSTDFDEFDPQRHFLVDYDSKKEVDMGGMSGCGVWTRLPSGEKNLCTPNIYLVGIETGTLERSGLIKATRADRVVGLVK